MVLSNFDGVFQRYSDAFGVFDVFAVIIYLLLMIFPEI